MFGSHKISNFPEENFPYLVTRINEKTYSLSEVCRLSAEQRNVLEALLKFDRRPKRGTIVYKESEIPTLYYFKGCLEFIAESDKNRLKVIENLLTCQMKLEFEGQYRPGSDSAESYSGLFRGIIRDRDEIIENVKKAIDVLKLILFCPNWIRFTSGSALQECWPAFAKYNNDELLDLFCAIDEVVKAEQINLSRASRK